MTLRQGIVKVQALRKEIDRGIKNAVDQTMAAGVQEAKRMSSGPLSLAELRRRDHPYAKRHAQFAAFVEKFYPERTYTSPLGNIPQGAALINDQGGMFKEAWGKSGAKVSPDGTVSGSLKNFTFEADMLMSGRGAMTVRPIEAYMADFIERTAIKKVSTAIKRLERIYG